MLFRRRKHVKMTKDKRNIIDKIEDASSKIRLSGGYKIANYLTRLETLIDNPHLELDDAQLQFISEELESISKHTNSTYEEYLIKKIDGIKNCIVDRTMNKGSELVEKTQEKIVDVKTRIDYYDREIKSISERMDEALGVNESLWKILNSEKKSLLNERIIDMELFNNLLNSKENAELVETIDKAKEHAEFIEDANSQIQDSDFEGQARYVGGVSKKVTETTTKIDGSLMKNFGGASTSDEYTKALEAKVLSQKGVTKGDIIGTNRGKN